MDRPESHPLKIEAYTHSPACCVEHDPLTAEVAARIAQALQSDMPSLCTEHIGSTAVPGCAGKGIVDLAMLYPPGQLAATRDLVDRLGFQHQPHRNPFPEGRPMRVGAIAQGDRCYQLHVHILAADSKEAANLLRFRDVLRENPSLLTAYVTRKREILEAGVTDSLDYCAAKSRFIERILGQSEAE